MLSSERERLLKALVPVRYCHVVEKKVRERGREREGEETTDKANAVKC